MTLQQEPRPYVAKSRPVLPVAAVTDQQQTSPEPTDTSSTATAKQGNTEDGIPADAHITPAPNLGDGSQEQAESSPGQVPPLENHVLYSIITIVVTGLAALSAACWLVARIETKSEGGYIKAVRIGGNVSSTWAKLIDAAASMLVAPAILAVANWHIFKLVRLSAVNEHDQRSSEANLNVLVEVAGTDWGSSSPLKFWTFLRSQKPRIICLGVISILSSLSFSLLGNVTAYEEAGNIMTTRDIEAMQAVGDFLKQPLLTKDMDKVRLKILDDLENQLQRLQATDLKPRPDGFLGVNITSRARVEMPPTIEQLFNVPAYRIMAYCQPSNLTSVSIQPPNQNNSHVTFTLNEATSPAESGSARLRADFGIVKELLAKQGMEAARTNGSSVRYPLIAFNKTATWIGGFSYHGDETVDLPVATRYGNLVPFREKGVVPALSCAEEGEDGNESYDLTFWGVMCSLNRWSGTATVNTTTWSLMQSKLDDEKSEAQDEMPVLLYGQVFDTFESGRVGRSPGIGGHLLRAALKIYQEAGQPLWDIETLVDAFVWYEVAVMEAIQDDKSDNKIDRLISQVEALENSLQRYTMTYVPWMLLSGLVTLGFACTLTVGLSLDSLRVPSFRSGRLLDAVRLTADVGMALEKNAFEEACCLSCKRLNSCAEKVQFKYQSEKRLDTDTRSYVMGVRLRMVPPEGEK
ncbi:hypothetical protein ACHAPT_013636 [Fusarium lateritium]